MLSSTFRTVLLATAGEMKNANAATSSGVRHGFHSSRRVEELGSPPSRRVVRTLVDVEVSEADKISDVSAFPDAQGRARHALSVDLAAAPLRRQLRKSGSSRCRLDPDIAATPRCREFDSRGEPGGEGRSDQVLCDDTSKRRLIAGTKRRMWPQKEATWNGGLSDLRSAW